MASNRLWVSLPTQSKSFQVAFLRVLEKISFRPKTSTLPIIAFLGLGLCSVDWMNWTFLRSKEPQRKRERVVWDFFDPQGHHEIQF